MHANETWEWRPSRRRPFATLQANNGGRTVDCSGCSDMQDSIAWKEAQHGVSLGPGPIPHVRLAQRGLGQVRLEPQYASDSIAPRTANDPSQAGRSRMHENGSEERKAAREVSESLQTTPQQH